MDILVACEESQRVAIKFREQGHNAYSCDTEPCSGNHPEWHYQQDVRTLLNGHWDIVVAFPPCTYFTNAGALWFDEEKYGEYARQRKQLRLEAFEFIKTIWNSSQKVCLENPVGWLNTNWRKPDQIIQPYQFGSPEYKKTCLWLKNLPYLQPTKYVQPKIYGYYKKGKNKGSPIYGTQWCACTKNLKERSKIRSKTFWGVAEAMAKQWSDEKQINDPNLVGLID